MVQVNLAELFKRLNETCHKSLEGAIGMAKMRTNYEVELEHWLARLTETPNTDFPLICKQFGVNTARLLSDLTRTIDGFKRGNARDVSLSPDLVQFVRDAWLLASVDFGLRKIRSGHLLMALMSGKDELRTYKPNRISEELAKIDYAKLREHFASIADRSEENDEYADDGVYAAGGSGGADAAGGEPGAPGPSRGPTKTPALDQFTIDLTAQAKAGKIDPVVGRDPEIRQIIDILTRRRQNNPILTGEAGVGKTAVVEGFALRVAAGDVPQILHNVSIRSLDLGLLQAGAGVKGEFENRLKSVINEVKSSPTPIIMFIDEAHTLIGAGGQSGQGDAANLLKPALARGELRTIAATTWSEYKKYFEKDAALTRRFQVVKVDEPNEAAAIAMMRGIVGTLEKHHGVRIREEAIVDSVRLSDRYITGRQLPDKSVSVLDTTCARIGISQSATPAPIEDCRRRIDQLKISLEILRRESETGISHDEKIAESEKSLTAAESELTVLNERWAKEKELVAHVLSLYGTLTGKSLPMKSAAADAAATGPAAAPGVAASGAAPPAPPAPPAPGAPPVPSESAPAAAAPLTAEQRQQARKELDAAEAELKALQADEPLVHVCVDAQAVAGTVSAWTGIPLKRMVADQVRTILKLKDHMEEAIIGQSHALEAIAQRIRTSRANLADPRTPIGVFLLAGTSGVGKTETAITLANLLYGGEQNMTVINMSEFKEEHKVSLLMGSPPGYVGYGEGGVLTEAVRRKPYSVVLLDEMEKAHPGVQDIFYQVFDKGMMKDGEGRDIDFKNTVILMTTNAGSELVKRICADPDTRPDSAGLAEALFPELLKTFKPAFLGRLTVVPYFPLTDDVLKKIVELKLGKIRRRVQENYKARMEFAPELIQAVADRCTEVDTGARNVDHILNGSLLPELSAEFLSRIADGKSINFVRIAVAADGRFAYEIS
jgi:type VI secretion system protein VasG